MARRDYIRRRIKEFAGDRPRFGYLRITALLRRSGLRVSKNTVYKIYKEEKLELSRKKIRKFKKRPGIPRVCLSAAEYPGERWSIDFIHDHLSTGRSIRIFSVIDQYSRKCLGLFVRKSFQGREVVNCLDEVASSWGNPKSITSDNGPEFTSAEYESWAHRNEVLTAYIQPGRPSQNGFIESFHGRFRDECLKMNIFEDLRDCEKVIVEWKRDYNNLRPHSSLNDEVPSKIWKQFQRDLDKVAFIEQKF